MVKYLKIIFLSVFFLSKLVYSQSADIVKGCVPLTVNFTAPSTATTYFWDFKDGVTSDHQNPSNLFNKPGIYNITFQESPGGPVIKTIKIEVFKKAEINIEKVVGGCYPFNAQIKSAITTDPNVTISKYTWVFGDGISDQGPTLSTVSHLYNNKGVYGISLGIETNYPTCDRGGLFADAVQVFDAPVAGFRTNPANTVTCNNTLPVVFTSTSTSSQALSYLWDFGNGKTSTLTTPPSQTYTPNSYIPKLTVKFASNLAGCESSASTVVSVGRPIPFIRKVKDSVCIYDTVRFISPSVGTKLWTVDAGASIYGPDTHDTVFVLFSKAGKHSITLKVTSLDGQCSDQTSVPIYVDEVLASIQHTPQNSCSSPMTVQYKADVNQSNVKYEWIFSGGSTSNNATPSTTYKSITSQQYYGINDMELKETFLTVTSKATGCWTKALSVDTLWLPAGRIIPDSSMGCAPLKVTFKDVSTSFDPIVKWKWLFGDGTTKTTTSGDPETITFNQVGKYDNRIVVTTQKGCIDTSYAITIEVGAKIPGLDFVASKTEVCPGEPVTFNTIMPANIGTSAGIIKGYHFTTEGKRSFHCDDDKDLTWSYNYLAGPQEVSLTVDANGCFTTIKKPAYINVKGTIAKIDYSAACNDPYNYHFKDVNTNATSLTWDFGDAAKGAPAIPGTANETHVYTKSGDYQVILTALESSSGCAATKDTVIVKARKLKADKVGDTLLCLNAKYTFNASKSVDVETKCYKGYDWQVLNSDIRRIVSSSPIAEFTFKKAENFTVRLVVSDVNGCKDTLLQKIKVFDIKPSITADNKVICNPATVNFFANKSTGDTTLVAWNWNFGDGTTSILENPSHVYTTPPASNSEYAVVMIVQDKIGCKDTIPMVIKQYTPTVDISASKTGICLGESVMFNATGYKGNGAGLIYNWDFGDATSSTLQSKSVLYANDQVYNVILKFEEKTSGCKGQTAKQISVQTYPKAAFISDIDSIKFPCAPRPVIFTDSSKSKYPITSHYWKFGNGEISTNKKYTLAYDRGDYTVQHIVYTQNGCSDTLSRFFKIFGPKASFSTDRNTICKGDPILFTLNKDTIDVVNYSWAFGDGAVVGNVAPVKHKYNFHPPSGSTIAKLIVTGSHNCSIPIEVPIYIHQVISDFDRLDGIDSTTCFNDGPYALTNKSIGGNSYSWDFGDGQTSTGNINSHAYANPGTYNVSLAIKNQSLGCVDTIAKKIVIFKNPVVQAVGDTVCQDKGIVGLNIMNPDPTSSFKWAPPIGLSSTTSTNPIATLQHSVIYQVVETDKNNCTDRTNVAAIIIESIGLRNLDTSIVIGDVISLPVQGEPYYRFAWTPSKGLSCLTCNYPNVQPLEDIRYNLNVTDVRGCYDQNYYYNIKIKPETFVKMPSMFTPNGDGNNDVVYVNSWGVKSLLEYQIFNRWGQLLFTTSNIHEGWDGTFNGALQSSDIYVYKVKAMSWRDEELKEEGYINLVR